MNPTTLREAIIMLIDRCRQDSDMADSDIARIIEKTLRDKGFQARVV